jgi:hypothetical protein
LFIFDQIWLKWNRNSTRLLRKRYVTKGSIVGDKHDNKKVSENGKNASDTRTLERVDSTRPQAPCSSLENMGNTRSQATNLTLQQMEQMAPFFAMMMQQAMVNLNSSGQRQILGADGASPGSRGNNLDNISSITSSNPIDNNEPEIRLANDDLMDIGNGPGSNGTEIIENQNNTQNNNNNPIDNTGLNLNQNVLTNNASILGPNKQNIPDLSLSNNNSGQEEDDLISGGDSEQDERELKFKTTIKFKKDLDSKWNSKTMLYNELVTNYESQGYKLVGSIEAHYRDSKTVVYIGDRESDFILLGRKEWLKTAFDSRDFVVTVNKIIKDSPSIMLMGTSRSVISPNGEEALKRDYDINRIQSKGGNKYELKFETADARNLAAELGVLATSGLKIKVQSWKKVLETNQCHRCLKYGHFKNECRVRMLNNIGNCRYCAEVDSKHESIRCPIIRTEDNHCCLNCKGKAGFKTHNAGERINCQFFIEYYMAKCSALKIDPEEKYVESEKRIKARDTAAKQGSKTIDNTVVNRKLASNMYLNRRLYGDAVGDYTKICNEIVDESIMHEYNAIKDLDNDLDLD